MDVNLSMVVAVLWLCPVGIGAFMASARYPSNVAGSVPRNFVLPSDGGSILFESVSSCGPRPPANVLAKQALVCEHAQAVQACRGLEKDAPFMTTRCVHSHQRIHAMIRPWLAVRIAGAVMRMLLLYPGHALDRNA